MTERDPLPNLGLKGLVDHPLMQSNPVTDRGCEYRACASQLAAWVPSSIMLKTGYELGHYGKIEHLRDGLVLWAKSIEMIYHRFDFVKRLDQFDSWWVANAPPCPLAPYASPPPPPVLAHLAVAG